jgi:hypothetical protein
MGFRSSFLRSVKQHGGVETGWRLLAKDGLSKGFDPVRKVGRLDLSIEAQVLRPHFIELSPMPPEQSRVLD